MAEVWAKSNGNWTDTTLWAFWNETTQQIEDYGQIPQVDDVVYCNGHTITLDSTLLDIGNGIIRNDINPHTSLSGGAINNPLNYNNVIITANFHCEVTTLFTKGTSAGGRNVTINGNIYSNIANGYFSYWGSYETRLSINGNVILDNGYLATRAGTSGNITINGNVTLNNTSAISNNSGNSGTFNIVVNGFLQCSDTSFLANKTANANGIIYIYGGLTYTTSTTYRYQTMVYVDNYLYYTNLSLPLNNITFLSNTIDFRYVGTEPNPNPYIIINPNTIADTYPTEDKVLAPTQYGAQMELVGQYTPDYPPESVVLKDYEYGDSDDRKTGTMVQEVNVEVGCVTPEDVRKDVPLVGMGVVGSLVVPSVDDVREGVIFDNGSVGTLIVEGGGDRLRIADFGYYTDSQSDTYIVDLTEQDKPKFAVAEERVLIEMFPDLDFDNIPEKYFDDLFVKYLKYRLIVEYYRTAGINSTFTPSEPTTEIVNYRNVNCEIWMNIANTYLKAWGVKYPNSIKKQRILL